jgi:hypothetical protein
MLNNSVVMIKIHTRRYTRQEIVFMKDGQNGMEWGPLSFVSTTEELLGRKSSLVSSEWEHSFNLKIRGPSKGTRRTFNDDFVKRYSVQFQHISGNQGYTSPK